MYDYDSRAKLRNNEFNYEQIMNIIKEVPCYIECVENQTEELQWIAIKGDYWSYQYIKNPTPEMTEYCLNQNGHIIQFIDFTMIQYRYKVVLLMIYICLLMRQ